MNNQFSALLVKYLEAKKINESKLVNNFITKNEASDYNGFPTEITKEIRDFCIEFVKKDLRSKDTEFTNFIVENSISKEIPKFEPKVKSWSSGEY